jgi:pimeloyl-ACP methyl ester carboxylesterase
MPPLFLNDNQVPASSARSTACPVVTASWPARTVVYMGGRPGHRAWNRLTRGLSPRRRMLAAGIAVVVAAAAVAIITAVLAGPGSGPAQPSGFPAQDRPGPVLLVPGYGGKTSSLAPLAALIRGTGRQATVLSMPGHGTGNLLADAAALNSAVTRALDRGAPSVDVIGYSAGGVVALLWAREDDGIRKARRVITLGSPFHGTSIAAGAEGFVPGACPTACQQLVPGSSLLSSLRAADPAGLPRWLSLWTTDDQTVKPPDSARLAGAINVPIQSLCPGLMISHSELPSSPAVTGIVLQEIGAGPLRYPTSADCRR